MKKLLLIFSATCLITITSRAQAVHFGVKAGVNLASIDHDPGDDFESKVGFHAGGLAHIHCSDRFAVQPELVYSAQGGERGDTKANLGYINLPVLAQLMLGDGFRLQTGPQVGFMLNAKHESGDTEVDVKDQLETMDFAWVVGASYIFPKGFGVDARYNHGLTNIYENNTIEQKNRVFQVGLFYQFMQHAKAKTK